MDASNGVNETSETPPHFPIPWWVIFGGKKSMSMPIRHIEGAEVKLHLFLTPALDGVQRSTSRLGCYISGEINPVPIEQKAGWTPVSVGTFWRRNKYLACTGNQILKEGTVSNMNTIMSSLIPPCKA
jgi:hypothetical protein